MKLGMPLDTTYKYEKKGISFYQSRVIMELNTTQLCQRGLESNIQWLRLALEKEAENQGMDLHEAFKRVMDNNDIKIWTKEDLKILDATNKIFRCNLHVDPDKDMYVVHRMDGKVLKPPGHPKPSLEGLY